MAEEELDLELDENNQEQIINRKDSRIKSLSDKVKQTSEERDALAKAKEEAEAKFAAAQKDAEFFKGFNTVSAKYQGASEYQDKIREKTNLGLDIEEATMLVLTKEGKYTPPTQPLVRENPAGGSAATSISNPGEKPLNKMSRDELRSQIQELEAKGEFKF